MADEVWSIREDGYLDLEVDCNSITYHPNLNIVIVLSKSSEVLVIDVNSGLLLQRTFLSANHNGKLQATYLAGHDKILLLDDRGVGVRTDFNGVLLLDTILQTPVTKPDDVVRLELLTSEAVLLQQTLISMDLPGVEHKGEVILSLTTQITQAQARSKKGIKAQKWNTVCLELPHCYLKWVCAGLVTELKRQNRHIPALAIASAVNERLNSLLPTHAEGQPVDRSLMFSEAMRRQTFSKWPHMNYNVDTGNGLVAWLQHLTSNSYDLTEYISNFVDTDTKGILSGVRHVIGSRDLKGCKADSQKVTKVTEKWALPDQMAQAGFYHQPNSSGDDRAMCFTCIVCLVCWEPSDEPWSEHERHSPSCPFVKGEYTQNVPLSVTYATAPAIQTDSPMEVLGTSSVPELIPTVTTNGSITIWNCSRQLKSEATINVVSKSSVYSDLTRKKEAWADQDVVEIPLTDATLDNLVGVWSNQEVKVGAVSVVGAPSPTRPVVVAGVCLARRGSQLVSPLVRAMNNVNQASSGLAVDIMKVAESRPHQGQLHLVVYDFHYRLDEDSGGGEGCASKTLVSGTGTSASRQENTNMTYPDIFLSKFLYSGPVLQDVVDADNIVYQAQDILVEGTFPAPSSSNTTIMNVPLGVAVPTAGGGTFDTSMAINEGLDITNFPSTSNGPASMSELLNRDLNGKSDAISDLSNGLDGSSALLAQEPVPIQSVLVDTSDRDMVICGLHPTRDGKHLLVVLKSVMETPCAMLVLYKLNLGGPAVLLVETPVCVQLIEQEIISLSLLPLEVELTTNSLGVIAVVTHDGQLSLIDIATLEVKATATHQDGGKFVSVTYCNSLERVCAASEKGSLHFFTLHDEEFYKSEENIFGEGLENNFCSPKQSTTKDLPLLVNAPTLDLTTLYELTRFENLVPCFAATVPACWSELMQAQKQRRHPQHLQHADDVHHTRSWRLQNDPNSWDEHVFELTLPRSVCVGHVDLKFSLHAQCQYPPNIQFTLLKQNASGIGKISEKSDVDSTIDFNISPEVGSKKAATVNPVTTELFARTHNTEILSGPINLASCLDLSDQSGSVTFTSPKLFRVRGRTLLVHIKALANHAGQSSQEREKRFKYGPGGSFWEHNGLFSPGSSVDRLASSVTNKKMEFNGCDWLHEISITIRKTKQTDIPNERAERCALLEVDKLVERLLYVVTCGNSSVQQNMALDILLWLAAVRLSRLRPVSTQQASMVMIVQESLGPLFTSCFVQGNRTVARKCVKFITLCSDGMKNAQDVRVVQFDNAVVSALVESLPRMAECWSAAALRWFLTLLSRTVSSDTLTAVAAQALNLLKQVACQLHARQNPYHLLLQTRFGLYGTPFEAELFDQEPPVPAKFSSTPLAYTTVVSGGPDGVGVNVGVNVMNMAGNSQHLANSSSQLGPGADDLRDLLNMKAKVPGEVRNISSQSQLRGLTANHYMKGLLEVQPLHFTCHATSDGTKLEKIDSGGTGGPLVNYFEAPPISPMSPILPNQVASNGPKKIVENDVERVPWQQLVMPPLQHMMVIERMHSGARRFVVLDLGSPVLLTDLFVPACPDLLSLSIDLWTLSEEQDAQRLVVAPDITNKTLIMNDIHPPPVVRFIKITTIGRYGMNTTKCKIPIGCFYGHLLVLPGEDYAEKTSQIINYPNPQSQLGVLNALFEDIQCRYSLACSKLQDLLSPLLTSEITNITHMHHYLRQGSDTLKSTTSKITTAYQECITYQHQLNSVRSVMRRLGAHKDRSGAHNSLASACTDKLRVFGEGLLDLLLYLAHDTGYNPKTAVHQWFDQPLCQQLFQWLCVAEDTRMQLSACTLLVRMCGLQPWWGDFLVETLTQLYSTQQISIFPQDRVFILLVYLGRKSLCGGASRSSVIDSVLRTLLQQLTPLAISDPAPGFLRSHMDLPLIGWLLLFLSQCLDSTASNSDELHDKLKGDKDSQGVAGRWDFLQGELSMQRRMNAVGRCSASRGYRRKIQKKLMHHKQQLEDLEVAKKAFQASTQVSGLPTVLRKKALSALSTQAAKLSYKLENALKQQEQILKKTVKQQASTSKLSKEPMDCRRADEASASGSKPRIVDSNNVLCLPRAHCLPVARALIALLLHMDFTCNLDTFLLTCKVLARVALWTRPSLLLGEVMTEEQLAHLVRLAVSDDQRRSTWACHAITCLLQDMLQGGARNKRLSLEPNPIEEEPEQEVNLSREEEPQASSSMAEVEEDIVSLPDPSEDVASPGYPSIKIKINSNFPLPSLLESDDSELEDLLDDILERGRNLTKKPPTNRVPLGIASTVSTALDSRLEYGVDMNAEVILRRMTAHGAYNLPMSVAAPISGPLPQQASGQSHPAPSRWDDGLTAPWQTTLPQDLPSSVEMLKLCFDKIFIDLTSNDTHCSLEMVLQLWLTLNLDNASGNDSRAFDASVVPSVALSPAAISALINVLANRAGVSVRCWCLAFQTLTLISNLPSNRTDNSLDTTLQRMARVIVTNNNFPKLLLAFFSSSQIKGCAGVTVCQCLHEMLVRLEMCCDVVSTSSILGSRFKLLLLLVLDQLIKPTGAITMQQGPLDAQAKLLQLMLHLDFTNTDVNTAFATVNSVALLVHSYMVSGEPVRWRSPLECGTADKTRPAAWDQLIISVVRLATLLVQIPLEAPQPNAASQTDEHKAASTKVPCVADIVVQEERTIHSLLSALGMSGAALLTDTQEPGSVGQAVFLLLSTLSRRATSPKFILKPVFTYISGNDGGLSEPLLSLVLRVIDGPEALQEFLALGALEVVCGNLVRAKRGLVNCQPSTVSVVMQHLSQAPALLIPQPPATKKAGEVSSGLLNFAPLGCISSSNPTAQPADVLIQSAPPHRRARAPAWSYHFYPDESWVELTITLPCAVLLREVQLQPHLTSLATCPSGVGIEVSRDGRSPLVPVSLPLDSSGLTFIRLQLPQPEVVTTVLLRLYKPRDSSNIGLSQIRLLGNTTFNGSANSYADEDDQSIDSSVGWVRLLHHCMTVVDEPQLCASVVSAATSVPGVLHACCGLLLTPAAAVPCLEHVLYSLGTHHPDLGLQTITTLLTNGSSQYYQGGLSNGVISVVELLFLLCTTQDSHAEERLKAVLCWLLVTASEAQLVSSTYVQCVAAILWANPSYSHMISNNLFSLVYQWTLRLEPRSALKRAVDTVLCSMCYIKPVLFPTLLQRMGALVPISATGHAASISDDRKDGESASQTDDSKKEEQEASEWYHQLVLEDLQTLQLSHSQLMTVAVACQSPPATLQLLDSGLPNLLTNAILEFCTRKRSERRCSKQSSQSRLTDSDKASGRNHVITEGNRPMVQLEVVSTILQFFAEVCSEGIMRDWLGSSKGSEFWLPLLNVLCNKPTNSSRCDMMSESLSSLESATVKFLSRCCWCHPNNQRLLANTLCDVISQQRTNGEAGISGVTRRLILQLLLESEKVGVCVRGLSAGRGPRPTSPSHPRYGVGHSTHLLYLSVHSTCADIIRQVANNGDGGGESKGSEVAASKQALRESLWPEVSEQLFVAAGVTAKDKRIKDAKNLHEVATSMFKDKVYSKKPNCSNAPDLSSNNEGLQHSELPGMFLPPSLTLSQLLTLLDHRGVSLSTPCIELKLTQLPSKENVDNNEALLATLPFPSPLQVFTQQGGLALLAEHLPLVYPETLLYFRSATVPPVPQTADQVDADWVKVEASDDIYEDVEESMVAPYMTSQGGKHAESLSPTVPLHSLAAFGLFLRLPGYAEVLLKDKRKAQCLLRLVLGVSDDGEGGDILSNPASTSLPTLPFEVLRQLLESTPLSTDDGVLLRRTTLDYGALHLLLTCLAVFTHQAGNADTLPALTSSLKTLPQSRNKSDDKSHLYWAKGTGFGTGSTTQSWNVEQALSRQRSEEQHVTVLLQVLSSYINPGGLVPADSSDEDSDSATKPSPQPLPACIHDLLQQSCLLPALSSYLRNDSVLDMARHIPLYRSVLQLLRAIAQNSQLVSLLLPSSKQASLQLSAVCLLQKMKNVVDTYASRLKINKPKNQKKMVRMSNTKQQEESLESDEGLALLIPDIQETANLVESATDRLFYEMESDSEGGVGQDHLELPLRKSLEERYLEVMKPLQFETFEMITETGDGNGFQFVVSYHFESNVRAGGDRSHPARVKRLAQETVTLSTSLPLSFSSSVFVRCDADRLDIMKVLITGPAETPYANGCFELDVYFPPDYPNSPMLINLETTGHHTIRFNPNLYNDGKVCLSVLNTWHGRPEEKWNAHTSSFLQVLVSIQSLILVPEPYFNEPGYERSRGTQAGNQSSREYNSNICQATVKWAMLEQLRNPSPCFKQVIQTHFWMKRKEIKSQIEAWIVDMESQSADRRTGRTISLNTMALKRHYQQLCEELAKLKPPPGLEDLADPDDWQQDMEKMVSQVCE